MISKDIALLFFSFILLKATSGQQKNAEDLFKSVALTPVNSFTNGVEGPAVDKDGNLYAVNFNHQGSIGKITPTGETSVFIDLPEGSTGNGIRFNRNGDMLIADYTQHNILKVDMATKQITVFANERKMNQPNDIAIDKSNCLYASDPDWKGSKGNIWRINKDGKVSLLEENMGTANGIEVSTDNKKLYVNESVQRKVWVYDLSKKGTVSNKKLLIEFPDFGMDGMRCDAKGNLYIARYGKGVIAVVSPEGKILHEISLIGKKPTNVAFGGSDGRTVYVTMQDNGNIESFRTDTAGREWQMQRLK